MHTETKYGVQAAQQDADILATIARAIRPAPLSHTTIVGIRNSRGEVYRIVYANGVEEALALTDGLERLGLVNDLGGAKKALERCDAVFAFRAFQTSSRSIGISSFEGAMRIQQPAGVGANLHT